MAIEETKYCRACFASKPENHIDIFKNGIAELYFEFTNLPISSSDPYSKFICVSCCNELKYWQSFKKKCMDSKIKYYEVVILGIPLVKTEEDEESELVSTIEIFPETIMKVEDQIVVAESVGKEIDESRTESIVNVPETVEKDYSKAQNQTFQENVGSFANNLKSTEKNDVRMKQSLVKNSETLETDPVFQKSVAKTSKTKDKDAERILEQNSKDPEIDAVALMNSLFQQKKVECLVGKKKNLSEFDFKGPVDIAKKKISLPKRLQSAANKSNQEPNTPIMTKSFKNLEVSKEITDSNQLEIQDSLKDLVTRKRKKPAHSVKAPSRKKASITKVTCSERNLFVCNIPSCTHVTYKLSSLKSHYYQHKKCSEGEDLQCNYENCEYSTTEQDEFIKHSLVHVINNEKFVKNSAKQVDGGKTYKCAMKNCSYYTNRKRLMTQHYNFHKKQAADDAFVTEICKKELKKLTKQPKATAKKKFVCNFENCMYATDGYRYLRDHLSQHVRMAKKDVIGKLKCNCCGKSFSNSKTLANHKKQREEFQGHIRNHFNQSNNAKLARKFACSQCDMKFMFQNLLKTHMKIHIEEVVSNYVCTLCGKDYKTAVNLKEHCFKHYKEDKMCRICKISYKEKKSLMTHQRKHHPELQFINSCEICCKHFSNSLKLVAHKRLHELPGYECDKCDWKSIYKTKLTQHMKEHRPKYHRVELPCNRCDKKFSNQLDLRAHVRDHNKPSRPVCGTICGTELILSIHLKKHEKDLRFQENCSVLKN